jgi:hypothetical protein
MLVKFENVARDRAIWIDSLSLVCVMPGEEGAEIHLNSGETWVVYGRPADVVEMIADAEARERMNAAPVIYGSAEPVQNVVRVEVESEHVAEQLRLADKTITELREKLAGAEKAAVDAEAKLAELDRRCGRIAKDRDDMISAKRKAQEKLWARDAELDELKDLRADKRATHDAIQELWQRFNMCPGVFPDGVAIKKLATHLNGMLESQQAKTRMYRNDRESAEERIGQLNEIIDREREHGDRLRRSLSDVSRRIHERDSEWTRALWPNDKVPHATPDMARTAALATAGRITKLEQRANKAEDEQAVEKAIREQEQRKYENLRAACLEWWKTLGCEGTWSGHQHLLESIVSAAEARGTSYREEIRTLQGAELEELEQLREAKKKTDDAAMAERREWNDELKLRTSDMMTINASGGAQIVAGRLHDAEARGRAEAESIMKAFADIQRAAQVMTAAAYKPGGPTNSDDHK